MTYLFSSTFVQSSEVTKSGLSSGLLVDWLEHLDPEVTSVCPELQQKLLFALNKVSWLLNNILNIYTYVWLTSLIHPYLLSHRSRSKAPRRTDRTCWLCSHISQTGPLSCPASALFSASGGTTSKFIFHFFLTRSRCFLYCGILLLNDALTNIYRLDPSSALDFLWACSHIPRIWQGRDQKIPQVSLKI